MGATRIEGQLATTKQLNDRAVRALQVLEIAKRPQMQDNVKKQLDDMAEKIRNAAAHCKLDYEHAKAARKSIKGNPPQGAVRWQEMGATFLEYLHGQLEKTAEKGSIALQLTNLQELDTRRFPLLATNGEATSVHRAIHGQPAGMEELFSQVLHSHLVTWAPKDSSQLQRVAAAWRKTMSIRPHLRKLSLLLPLNIPPGCRSAAHVGDIWNHPILKNKFQDVVSEVLYMTPQAQFITTGVNGPLHQQKCLAVIILGDNAVMRHTPTCTTWADTWYENLTNHVLVVDLPEEHRWKVHRILNGFRLPHVVHIDNPKPSPGSSKLEARSAIHIHFSAEVGTQLGREILATWICKQLIPFQPLVGWTDTLAAEHALLLDVPSPTAAATHSELCTNQVVISPTLIVITTFVDHRRWRDHLTQAWLQDPTKAGERVRFRPSSATQETFAQVEASKEKLAMVRARKGHAPVPLSADRPRTLQATVHIPLGTEGSLESWMADAMGKLAGNALIPLKRAEGDYGLGIREWRPIFDVEGAWTEQVIVQCSDESELRRLHKAMHGKKVNIGGHSAAVRVQSDFVQMDL